VVPDTLKAAYGNRANTGFAVYLTLRPAAMMHGAGSAASHPADHTQVTAAPAHVMVQTALDPARLSCSPKIDPKTAARATYEGKTYYFCTAKERDLFLTNPAMSLAMMPPKQ
jgi:YHS domain-containing protein